MNEDPFSTKDWDGNEVVERDIIVTGNIFPYGDDTTLEEMEEIDNAERTIEESKKKEVIEDEPFVLS